MTSARKTKPKVNKISRITIEQCFPNKDVFDEKLETDLQLLRGILRSPLGTYPDRDKEIMAVWRSKA